MQQNQTDSKPSITLGDIYYVLFKHKRMILLLTAAGLLAAFIAFLTWPIQYSSEARILIRYVRESKSPAAVSESTSIKPSDPRGDAIMNSEIEILTSFDVAQQVAATVGAEKILAKAGKGAAKANDLAAAAMVVNLNLEVTASRQNSVLHIAFHHPDHTVVQPVLAAIVDLYRKKHVEIHQATGWHDDFLAQETDKLRSQLTQTEEDLRKAKDRIGVLSLAEAKKSHAEQLARVRNELLGAEAELAERQATLNQMTGVPSDSSVSEAESKLPPDQVAEYRRISGQLERLREQEQALTLTLMYREEHPLVKAVHGQITEMESRKTSLESAQPALAALHIPRPTEPIRPGVIPFDPGTETARVRGIESRIKLLNEHLEKIRRQGTALSEAEPAIAELERQKELQEIRFRALSTSREQVRIVDALGDGKVSNIADVQSPSPPLKDTRSFRKVLAGLLFGGLLAGLGLAFVWELLLNQTVRRPSEIEGRLGMPLLLSIPWVGRNGKMHLGAKLKALIKASNFGRSNGSSSGPAKSGESGEPPATEVAPWALNHGLRAFVEALRDRLVFYFEVRSLTHKPKLVAVTGCAQGSGVSTIAAGLAATLSETGDGNVLLVDMNMGHHQPCLFHKGDLQRGLSELLEGDNRESAMVQNNLYVVSHAKREDKLERIMPTRFNHLIPKLKASDYDYIIFDMPPVSQISVTPQLARYMDMVLMVVESEQTNRDAVTRARNLLAESKANISIVLNKTRNYVPRQLQQEM